MTPTRRERGPGYYAVIDSQTGEVHSVHHQRAHALLASHNANAQHSMKVYTVKFIPDPR